jgi:valine--pyruvate aminotransferase
MWFQDLPMTDWELYQELKKVGVIAVPGSSFFPGLREDWKHKHECIRLSLTASDEAIEMGMERLAKVVEEVFQGVIA